MSLIINTLAWLSKLLHLLSRSIETVYWGLEWKRQIRNIETYRSAIESTGIKVVSVHVCEPSISPESGHIWMIWIEVRLAATRTDANVWAKLEERIWDATDHLNNSRSQLILLWS